MDMDAPGASGTGTMKSLDMAGGPSGGIQELSCYKFEFLLFSIVIYKLADVDSTRTCWPRQIGRQGTGTRQFFCYRFIGLPSLSNMHLSRQISIALPSCPAIGLGQGMTVAFVSVDKSPVWRFVGGARVAWNGDGFYFCPALFWLDQPDTACCQRGLRVQQLAVH
ncbi:uncharacterized protein BCR38DRAFT_83043 [Pseudomassariella vexata]|uniref:Uncharacterized protein n=1 Tax=Pseudomassariella vexata TaxID=1141098 RepID=A0A1Y2DEA9_9PEZI|nr:uncharacterized protein BCR38DRAFT_83043 [Pseudomassariella vexata]ORY57456.1 hypothetical protein BCR38DRAFT_83043 [Pseudomassariella vexata]